MADTAIELKVKNLFNAMDTNNDGYVEWADYQRAVDRYLTTFRTDRDTRKGLALQVGYQMLWLELLRHANREQRLARDEYVAANRAASLDTSRFNMVEGIPHALFDIIDSDDDNKISEEEFSQLMKLWGVTASDETETFTMLDRDKDGYISRQEFLRAGWKLAYSADLATPGSLYFEHL
jgi:Ca2+-binding EF-hand superfamily protein